MRHRYLDVNGRSHESATTLKFGSARDHPSGHPVELIEPCAVRPLRARIAQLSAAPRYGENTVQILAELGYRQDEIEDLRRRQVVSDQWSDDYLPD